MLEETWMHSRSVCCAAIASLTSALLRMRAPTQFGHNWILEIMTPLVAVGQEARTYGCARQQATAAESSAAYV
jgi:hypothetical protein